MFIAQFHEFESLLLVGSYASIDETDGAGMNLMDINQRSWSKTILQVCQSEFSSSIFLK
jgi:xylulokinase